MIGCIICHLDPLPYAKRCKDISLKNTFLHLGFGSIRKEIYGIRQMNREYLHEYYERFNNELNCY